MIIHSTLMCLSLVIFFEARGEPLDGQLAVAHVVMNRSENNNTSICQEVFKKSQFSWTKRQYKIPKGNDWKNAQDVARIALNSSDSIKGATFFFNPKKCGNPVSIVKGRKRIKSIGNHIFYADK